MELMGLGSLELVRSGSLELMGFGFSVVVGFEPLENMRIESLEPVRFGIFGTCGGGILWSDCQLSHSLVGDTVLRVEPRRGATQHS